MTLRNLPVGPLPAVLWDFDGKLTDTDSLWLEIEREVLEAVVRSLPDGAFSAVVAEDHGHPPHPDPVPVPPGQSGPRPSRRSDQT